MQLLKEVVAQTKQGKKIMQDLPKNIVFGEFVIVIKVVNIRPKTLDFRSLHSSFSSMSNLILLDTLNHNMKTFLDYMHTTIFAF